jgi:hypothetical protein
LALYFKRSGFGPETYTDRWVKLPVGPFTLYLPNVGPRRQAVPLHDVNHVITEYPTNWTGEFEISGYELGSGLGSFWFGWVIDLQGVWGGVLLRPIRTLRAFARGRRARSVYSQYSLDSSLKNMRLGDLRAALGVVRKDDVSVTIADGLALLGRLLLSVVVHAPIVLVPLAALWWWSQRP